MQSRFAPGHPDAVRQQAGVLQASSTALATGDLREIWAWAQSDDFAHRVEPDLISITALPGTGPGQGRIAVWMFRAGTAIGHRAMVYETTEYDDLSRIVRLRISGGSGGWEVTVEPGPAGAWRIQHRFWVGFHAGHVDGAALARIQAEIDADVAARKVELERRFPTAPRGPLTH